MSDTTDPTISSLRRTPLHWGDTPRQRGLPRDLAEKAVKRLSLMALIYGAVHVIYLLLPTAPEWHNTMGRRVSMVFAAVSLAVFLLARLRTSNPYRMIDMGLVFQVLGAIGIEIAMLWWQGGWWEGVRTIYVWGISWVCVWIVSFPLMVPSSPSKVALAAFLSASVRPLLLLFMLAQGTAPRPPGFEALMWVIPNYICVGIAIVSAYVMYGIGEQVSKAQQLGSYKLDEKLGAGGMGEVWRAQHQMLARPAAIKLIRSDSPGPSKASDAMVKRFEREAQATASLQSPHTVSLYDYGVSRDGTFYYVMELLNGLDLRALVERFGPLPAERAVHLIAQACESLAEAHGIGLIHRDIKPANIYACRLGLRHDFIKVLDFGLVKKHDAVQTQTALTVENAAAGTPQFMAPEVALGKPADARSDIYALGCTAYWLVTGQNVFAGNNAMQVVVDHIRTEPQPPSERTELPIPGALEKVILECLAKVPSARPVSAEVLREQLAAVRLPAPWNDSSAAKWWNTHLPDLANPKQATTGQTTEASA